MQSKLKIKAFRLENGKGFISKAFNQICYIEYDIVKKTSTLYQPQQNGVAKYAYRTIVEKAKNMLQKPYNFFGQKRWHMQSMRKTGL